ncbi:MAG TPA: transposase, partial [Thermoanaerobaculia bacterium]|nr:transposase [Thermoanaerobaculia bacterium]
MLRCLPWPSSCFASGGVRPVLRACSFRARGILVVPSIPPPFSARSNAPPAVPASPSVSLPARSATRSPPTSWSKFHPHVHCVVPGGGFSFDGRRWVHVPTGTFLSAVKVLSRRFRTLVKNAITEAYHDGSLQIPPHIARDRTALDLLLACASKTDWHTYVKRPFGGPEQVLGYLAAYTHRVAISNQRISAFDGERVTFRYRDYHDGNAQK